MKVQPVNHENELQNIISSIGKSSSSWKGWLCLRVEIEGEDSSTLFRECYSWIQSIVKAYLYEIEGNIYFCHNDHVHIFCKNISYEIMDQVGQQISDFVSFEDKSLEASYFIYDLYKDGFAYVSSTAGHEDGFPISIHSGLDPFIDQAISYVENEAISKNNNVYKNDKKVLLIEDDPITRWMVRRTIKSECELLTASTANKAFSVFGSFHPDIVFLDIDLPDQNGKQVLQWLMANDPGICVVMFSSNNNLENITETLAGGASGFIPKPFFKQDLLHYIHSY